MKSSVRTGILRPSQRCSRAGMLWVWVGAAILFGLNVARASFHVWAVTELYSSADGSVQFIKLTNNSTFTTEYFLGGLVITGITLHSYRYTRAERAKTVDYPERFAQQ